MIGTPDRLVGSEASHSRLGGFGRPRFALVGSLEVLVQLFESVAGVQEHPQDAMGGDVAGYDGYRGPAVEGEDDGLGDALPTMQRPRGGVRPLPEHVDLVAIALPDYVGRSGDL